MSASYALRIAAWSDPGKERDYQEDNNCVGADLEKDNWVMPSDRYTPGTRGALLVVADGMGGLNAGEVASAIAVKSLKSFFSPERVALLENTSPEKILIDSILFANAHIVDHAKQNLETEGMGTTLTVAWILGQDIHVAWSGDSRCYLLRQEEGLMLLTKDHSYVQELIDSKQLSDEDAFFHPQKNIITQSLGDIGRAPSPSYRSKTLCPGDRILLCSDGLNTMLHDPEIALLAANGEVRESAVALVQAANDAGGYDNITVLLAEVFPREDVPMESGLNSQATLYPSSQPAPPPKEPDTRKRMWTTMKPWQKGVVLAIVFALLLGLVLGGLWIGGMDGSQDKVSSTDSADTIPDGMPKPQSAESRGTIKTSVKTPPPKPTSGNHNLQTSKPMDTPKIDSTAFFLAAKQEMFKNYKSGVLTELETRKRWARDNCPSEIETLIRQVNAATDEANIRHVICNTRSTCIEDYKQQLCNTTTGTLLEKEKAFTDKITPKPAPLPSASPPTAKPDTQPTKPEGKFAIQIGCYKLRSRAEKSKKDGEKYLKTKVAILEQPRNGGKLYCVSATGYATRAEAIKAMESAQQKYNWCEDCQVNSL